MHLSSFRRLSFEKENLLKKETQCNVDLRELLFIRITQEEMDHIMIQSGNLKQSPKFSIGNNEQNNFDSRKKRKQEFLTLVFAFKGF